MPNRIDEQHQDVCLCDLRFALLFILIFIFQFFFFMRGFFVICGLIGKFLD